MGDHIVTEVIGIPPYTTTVTSYYSYVYRGVPMNLEQVCYDRPAVAPVEAVPEVTETDNMYGWNASAYSTAARSGDIYTQFTIPAGAIGVVCGLAPERKSHDPRDVNHAFYVYQSGGRELWRVTENGVGKTDPVVRAPDSDLFRIERRGSTVTYFFNNRGLYTSAAPSIGTQCVVACLYAAGDGVD